MNIPYKEDQENVLEKRLEDSTTLREGCLRPGSLCFLGTSDHSVDTVWCRRVDDSERLTGCRAIALNSC